MSLSKHLVRPFVLLRLTSGCWSPSTGRTLQRTRVCSASQPCRYVHPPRAFNYTLLQTDLAPLMKGVSAFAKWHWAAREAE